MIPALRPALRPPLRPPLRPALRSFDAEIGDSAGGTGSQKECERVLRMNNSTHSAVAEYVLYTRPNIGWDDAHNDLKHINCQKLAI